MVTVVPFGTETPAPTDWRWTMPSGNPKSSRYSDFTLSPAFLSAAFAAETVMRVTSGTWTGGGPLLTTIATVEPLSTFAPLFGDWLMTEPLATASEKVSVALALR